MLTRTHASDFFNVATRTVTTSLGPVDLPILYFDTSMYLAFFVIDASRARARLESTGLVPIRLPGDKALAGIAFYEYRNTSIGRYNEVGVGIAVHPREAAAPRVLPLDFLKSPANRTMGFHILELPVTTPAANAAGREIWGYPKFITQLPMKFTPWHFEGTVLDPDTGDVVLSLEGPMDRGIRLPVIDLVLYSCKGQELIKTVVDVAARAATFPNPGDVRLQVGTSSHHMASTCKELGLHQARPVLFQGTNHFQSRLNGGTPIAIR